MKESIMRILKNIIQTVNAHRLMISLNFMLNIMNLSHVDVLIFLMDMRHCKVLVAEHFLIRDINQKSSAGTQNEQSWHVKMVENEG